MDDVLAAQILHPLRDVQHEPDQRVQRQVLMQRHIGY